MFVTIFRDDFRRVDEDSDDDEEEDTSLLGESTSLLLLLLLSLLGFESLKTRCTRASLRTMSLEFLTVT